MEKDPYTNSVLPVSDLKLKVCGMGSEENILEVASLKPDYIGFIFHEKSTRNFRTEIPEIPSGIKKTGVFVDSTLDFIIEKVKLHQFQAVQLHGEESAEFCRELKNLLNKNKGNSGIEIIKVFSIKDEFDFQILKEFEGEVDYFLFDTKGENKGGNGVAFNWEILKSYPSSTPFFLSGGIGIEEVENLKELMEHFKKPGRQKILYAIDVNSKFEISPSLKNIDKLKEFKLKLLSQQEIK